MKADLTNRDDSSRLRQSHGNLILSDGYSASKISACDIGRNNYYNAVWKSDTEDAYGGNPMVYNPLLRSMTNNKHLERNWQLFYGTIQPTIEPLEQSKCVSITDSRNCEEILGDIRESMKHSNDLNYKVFNISDDKSGDQMKANGSSDQNMCFDSQVVDNNGEGDALDDELNKERVTQTPVTKAR